MCCVVAAVQRSSVLSDFRQEENLSIINLLLDVVTSHSHEVEPKTYTVKLGHFYFLLFNLIKTRRTHSHLLMPSSLALLLPSFSHRVNLFIVFLCEAFYLGCLDGDDLLAFQ